MVLVFRIYLKLSKVLLLLITIYDFQYFFWEVKLIVSIIINKPVIVDNKTKYTSVIQHRGKVNNNKSIWTINLVEEVDCFKKSYSSQWQLNCKGWGLHIIQDRICVLGKNPEGENLKIAKFVDSSNDNSWHGYPADYRSNIQDRPTQHILEMWREEGIIKKHHMSKIRSGMPCNI